MKNQWIGVLGSLMLASNVQAQGLTSLVDLEKPSAKLINVEEELMVVLETAALFANPCLAAGHFESVSRVPYEDERIYAYEVKVNMPADLQCTAEYSPVRVPVAIALVKFAGFGEQLFIVNGKEVKISLIEPMPNDGLMHAF